MNNPIITKDKFGSNLIHILNQKEEVIRMLVQGGDVHDSINNKVFCCVIGNNCAFSTVEKLGQMGKIGVPYLLEIDRKKYVAKVSEYNPRLEIQTLDSKMLTGACFVGDNKEVSMCMGLDEYTNEVIIGYVVTNCMEQNGMIKNGHDFAITQTTSSICGNKGVNIIPYMSYGSLDGIGRSTFLEKYREEYTVVDPIEGTVQKEQLIKADIIRCVMSQIITGLHRLSNDIEFSSGDLKPGNILISNEKVIGRYHTLDVSGPFKCKIADFGKSSCTIINDQKQLVRIYNTIRSADLYLYFQPFKANIHSDPSIKGGYYYIIDQLTVAQVYALMRHNINPYYRHFDYYVFMVSFLAIPEIYYSFFGTPILIRKFWQSMWISKADADDIQNEIRKNVLNKRQIGTHEAINILRNRRLRCSILDHIIKKDPIPYFR